MALLRPPYRLLEHHGRCLLVIVALTCGALAQAFAERIISYPSEPLLAVPLFALGALLLLAGSGGPRTDRETSAQRGQSVDVTAFPAEPKAEQEPYPNASAPLQRSVPRVTSARLHLHLAGAIEAIHPSTRLSGAIYLAFALLAGSLAAAYTGVDLSVIQLACYGVALGTLVQTARAFDRAMPAGRAQEDMRLTHLDALLLTLATAPALILRVIFIDSLPPVAWPDELDYLSNALSVLQGKLVSPFISGTWDAVFLHAYSIAVAALLVPDNTVALRLVSVVPGVLSVPLQYLFLRELFRNRVLAFSASMLFAFSSWHILMSRLGYHWSINGFAELVALYWFARAQHSGRPQHFVFSGFGLGLGILYKYAATLMPLTMMLFAVYLLLFHRQLVTRRLIVGFALLTLSTAIVVGPRLSTIIAHPQMNARVDEMMILAPRHLSKAPEVIPRQLREILFSFNYLPDEHVWNQPRNGGPLLDPLSALTFGLGAFYALFRFRRAGWALLILTFLVMLLPSAIVSGVSFRAASWRACGTVAALFGLAAVPFAVMWQIGATDRFGRRVLFGVLSVVFTVIGVLNYYYYFIAHFTHPIFASGWPVAHFRAVKQMVATSPETRVVVNHDLATSRYFFTLTPGWRSYDTLTWPDTDPFPTWRFEELRPTLVMASALRNYQQINAGDTLIDLLAHYYPRGVRHDERDVTGELMYSTYFVQPEQVRGAHGFTIRYRSPDRLSVERTITTNVFDWRRSPTGLFPVSAEIRGTLVVPQAGVYEVALTPVDEHQIALNGQSFTQGYLLPGLYEIVIQAEVHEPTLAQLVWRRDGGQLTPVPDVFTLQKGLPQWGLIGIYHITGTNEGLTPRWLPSLWFYSDRQDASAKQLQTIEWLSDVRFPETGEYQFHLASGARSRLWLDGQPAPPEQERDGGQRWQVQLTAGWHRIRIVHEAPQRQDFRFYWTGPRNQRVVLGGRTSEWPQDRALPTPRPSSI